MPRMPNLEMNVIEMYCLDDMNERLIATATGIPVLKVQDILHRHDFYESNDFEHGLEDNIEVISYDQLTFDPDDFEYHDHVD